MTATTDRSETRHRAQAIAVVLTFVLLPLTPLPGSAQTTPPGFVRGTLAVRAHVGVSASEASPVLPGLDDGLPGSVGLTVWPRPSWLVAVDLGWIGWSRSFPTEDATNLGALLTVNDRVDLGTNAVTAGLRLSLPPGALVRPYAAAGLGWIHHKAQLDGSLFFIPGTVAESTSTDWTFYWGGGIDTRFGSWGVSLDYRRLDTTASFGGPFDIPSVDLGGSSFFVGASWWPGS
jgi:hypothetical protein